MTFRKRSRRKHSRRRIRSKPSGEGILNPDGSFTYEPDTEAKLSEMTARYLRQKFPDIPFNIDVLAGINLSTQQGARAKKQGKTKSWPDIFIAAACHGYHGLFIEQKKYGERVFQVNQPDKYASKHIAAQATMLDKLRAQGYFAAFAIGFGETKDLLDWYLGEQ